jgi:hypothetical protein
MKPTQQQVEILQKYLHDTLTYRETYAEIYDHILTAIEYQPEEVPFEDAVKNIINNDFGSAKNLLKVEKAAKDALVEEAISRFLKNLVWYAKFPGLLYTLTGAYLVYYIFGKINMSLFATEVIIALLAVMPGLIYLLRLYNTGYILDTTQKSARDKLFETLAGIPIRLFVVVNLFIPMINGSDKWLWLQTTPYTLTISLLLLTLYNLSLYKLYKDEFRVSAI